MRKVSFIVLVLITFASCTKREERPKVAPVEQHYEYAIAPVGTIKIFSLDSLVYFSQGVDTIKYDVKEEYIDSIITLAGRKAAEVVYSARKSGTSKWQLLYRYTLELTADELLSWRESTSRVKLAFPIEEGKEWDAERYNVQDSLALLNSIYTATHVQDTVTSLGYDSTVVVQLEDFRTFISEDVEYETYGKNIGLIYKYHRHLDLQKNPKEGVEVTLRLKEVL